MRATLSLALRMLLRDWRSGELRLLVAALVIAVASVTSVGFFTDRVGQALVRDAHQLLGADLVLVSDYPWPAAIADEIPRRGLEPAAAVNFISMVQATRGGEEKTQLAGVKAVTANYPLRGRLRIAPGLHAPDAPAGSGPARGTVWLDERLSSALGVRPGDRVRLGRSEFTFAAVLTLEPERSANFFNLAPRLTMHADDMAATGLVQVGSRIRYYLYAAGAREQVSAFEAWVRSRLQRGQRVDNLESGRPEVRAAIERAQRFLGLAALLAAVLAGVAIALGTRRFVERHLEGCAVMRCVGATQRRLLTLYSAEFLVLGIVGCAGGSVLGFAVQGVIAYWLVDLIRAPLPLPTALPALQGFLTGLVLLLGFALPPLLQLKNVPAIRVIRREAGTLRPPTLLAYAGGFGAFAGLLLWQAGDLRLGSTVVAGFAIAACAFVGVAWLLLRALTATRLVRGFSGRSPMLRYGLANLRRHARANAVQVASLALGLTALLLLTVTRGDLVDAWRRAAPPDAPNRFVLNIQGDQLEAVRAFFAQRRIVVPDVYPMVRGRLIAVNGRNVSDGDYAEERAKRLVEREFNLSYMAQVPQHNVISAGRWFSGGAHGEAEISVEEGIARTLGFRLGDALTYSVGGETFTARVTSLRRLRWDSMKVNFFVIAPPWVLERFPTSFICALRVAPEQEGLMNELAAQFPNLTIVDVAAAVRQAQSIIDQLIVAVQFVFLFALGAGLLVLYAALVSTEDERRREAALMRVIGASRAQVTGSQRIEFLAMGLIAGLLATAAAAAIGEVVASRAFDLDLPVSLWLWLAGPVAGMALLSFNAWISARKVLGASPARVLRDSI
ncbi:MAG: FtsX-like permease family protein [Betaproteobacteria bacterium]|nr:FtsX-like permease family protein [Betaproteobacteria bacterium]